MNPTGLFVVVAAQVATFQFAAVRLSRVLPDLLVGTAGLPAGLSARIEAYRSGVGRGRFVAGAILGLAALLAAFVLPLEPSWRKRALAAVSLASSAVFVAGYVHDRRRVAALAAQLPPQPLRAAALEPRTAGQYVSTRLQAIPLAVLLLTVAATLWAQLADGDAAAGVAALGLRAWMLPVLQLIVLAGSFVLTRKLVTTGDCTSSSARAMQDSVESGLRLDEAVRRLEVRHTALGLAGCVFLLGLMQLVYIARARESAAATWVSILPWVLIVAMLGLFAAYLARASGLRKAITPADRARTRAS